MELKHISVGSFYMKKKDIPEDQLSPNWCYLKELLH